MEFYSFFLCYYFFLSLYFLLILYKWAKFIKLNGVNNSSLRFFFSFLKIFVSVFTLKKKRRTVPKPNRTRVLCGSSLRFSPALICLRRFCAYFEQNLNNSGFKKQLITLWLDLLSLFCSWEICNLTDSGCQINFDFD